MRGLLAVMAFFISFVSVGQDINYKLAGDVQRKWIGESIILDKSAENFTNLTFYKYHKVVEYNRKYNASKPILVWDIVEGKYLNDENIVIQIGSRKYHLQFSKTNNGNDFMTLSSGGEGENEEYIIKTFYAE